MSRVDFVRMSVPHTGGTDPILSLTREETNRFTYLCDLLYNFISGHNFRGYFYVASSQILSRVPTLFKARDKHLQHGMK